MKYFNNLKLAFLTFCSLFMIPGLAMAVPHIFSHHGMIYKEGVPYNGAGVYMNLYLENEDGRKKIADKTVTIDVVDGYYTAAMELDDNQFNDFINCEEPIYLRITFEYNTIGRLPINSVPYALKADSAKNAELAEVANTALSVKVGGIDQLALGPASVINEKIAPNAVTSAKIEDHTITYNDLADYAVITQNIASNAVTTDKIKNGTITKEDLNITNILNWLYPVGSIYITLRDGNPYDFLGGGTWKRVAKGMTLVGEGQGKDKNGETKTFSIEEEQLGEYKHKLTVTEMPSHTHNATTSIQGRKKDDLNENRVGPVMEEYSNNDIISISSQLVSTTINSTGGNAVHNNIQPYMVVYIWQRTN